MTDATGTSTYLYDPFDELASATNGAQQVTGYSYNADGQPATITYPLPATATWATSSNVTYGYDNADRLASVTDFTGNKITITPSSDGPPATQSLGSTGDTITTSYDNTDNPSAITLKNSSTILQSFSYSDDPSGNTLTETDTPSSPTSPATYTYDPQSRVASMTPGTQAQLKYGFDASSNLTTLPNGATGTYDKAGELSSATLSGATTSYTYNADGQRTGTTQSGTTTAAATWNGAGELTSYSDGSGEMTSATYNGDGLRAASTTSSAGTQQYLWNGQNLLMDSANAYIYTAGTAPAEQVNLSTGIISYLVTDSHSSVRGIVSNSGSLTATCTYDAWGNPLIVGGLTSITPFGYAGSYTDATGLVYLIHRYYDPQTGQFLSVDPDLTQTLQAYIYGHGDPVMQTDPTGEYGYQYRYLIGTGLAPHRILNWVIHHFDWVFPFPFGCPNNLYVGLRCSLDYFAPIQVTGIWQATFQIHSLPGHPEGANHYINFTFREGPWYELWPDWLYVTAWGPNDTWCNDNYYCSLGNADFAYWTWQLFAIDIGLWFWDM